jgi:Uma2 family endonuclease
VLLPSDAHPIRRGDREVATPILVVEVHSPSTESRDRDQKVRTYLRAGVGELWLVNPRTAAVEIHRSRGVEVCQAGAGPESEAVPGFRLDLSRLLDG